MRKRKIKLSVCVVLSIAILVSSCSDTFCDKFDSVVKSQCVQKNDKCYITLDKVFNFEWDSLYVFDSELYPDEVSSRLRTDCNCKIIPDGQRRIYFVREGKIVKQYVSKCYKVNFVEKKDKKGDGVVVIAPQTVYLVENRLVNDKISYYLFNE